MDNNGEQGSDGHPPKLPARKDGQEHREQFTARDRKIRWLAAALSLVFDLIDSLPVP